MIRRRSNSPTRPSASPFSTRHHGPVPRDRPFLRRQVIGLNPPIHADIAQRTHMPTPQHCPELKSLRIHTEPPPGSRVTHTAVLTLAPGLTADCYETRLGNAWIINAPDKQPCFTTSRAVNLYFARRRQYQQGDTAQLYRRWARDVAQRHRRPSARFLGACRLITDWLAS
jgi:hypothetical protein